MISINKNARAHNSLFKISRRDIQISIYLGIIGMIVDPGLVTDGSANDAIPPTRGF